MANRVKGKPANKRTKRSDARVRDFLAVLRSTGNVSEAARTISVSRRSMYEWKAADSAFAAAWDEAAEEAVDRLEREAWRRGVEGIPKPVTHQGKITDTYTEYSDRMLELLLKGHRPEKYRDNRTEISGTLTVQRVERVVIDTGVQREIEREADAEPAGG